MTIHTIYSRWAAVGCINPPWDKLIKAISDLGPDENLKVIVDYCNSKMRTWASALAMIREYIAYTEAQDEPNTPTGRMSR